VLYNLSEQVRRCHRQAHECARKAQTARTEHMRRDFLALERNWLALARSCDFSERVADFAGEAERRRHHWRQLDAAANATAAVVPFLAGQAFTPEIIRELFKAFDLACETLEVSPRSGEMAERIGRKIIYLAQCGLRDGHQLAGIVIEDFKANG